MSEFALLWLETSEYVDSFCEEMLPLKIVLLFLIRMVQRVIAMVYIIEKVRAISKMVALLSLE